MTSLVGNAALIIIAALATFGVIARPWGTKEAPWAVGGAALLVITGLLPVTAAAKAIYHGLDVYLFLAGMMLLSELARREGLFDTLAARTVRAAKGSPKRLFFLIYAVGIIVTTFMSNDATAVVLTPAVLAVAKAAQAEPLPLVFICAFIANAASFILPISNPANLVLYDNHLPSLPEWLGHFALPSLASIGVTLGVLYSTQRKLLKGEIAADVPVPELGRTGYVAGGGILLTAIALLGSSAFGLSLGWPTCLCGMVTAVTVLGLKREKPGAFYRKIDWSILPLVAGLFVLVAGLNHAGFITVLRDMMEQQAAVWPRRTAWAGGMGVGFISNLMNNLPAGLIAGQLVQGGSLNPKITNALLIGVDLGPNLSITGSLATILWLSALRRGGVQVSAWQFLKLGALLMPLALIVALAAAGF